MAKQVVTFRASEELVSRLDDVAKSNDNNRTDVIIFALEYLLERVEDN